MCIKFVFYGKVHWVSVAEKCCAFEIVVRKYRQCSTEEAEKKYTTHSIYNIYIYAYRCSFLLPFSAYKVRKATVTNANSEYSSRSSTRVFNSKNLEHGNLYEIQLKSPKSNTKQKSRETAKKIRNCKLHRTEVRTDYRRELQVTCNSIRQTSNISDKNVWTNSMWSS